MYWYEICCHAVTFFLCNFLNIFFNSFLPSYMWKIYSKFHLNLLSCCREKWWTDVHSHGTAYFIYRYWIYWLQHPPNQFFILCKRPTKTIKLTSDRVHTDMIVLKFGDFFSSSKLHFSPKFIYLLCNSSRIFLKVLIV